MSIATETDVVTAAQLFRAGTLMIDVREPAETNAAHVSGSLLMPLSTIAGHLDEIPKDRQVLLLCASGGRSARLTQYLRANGWDKITNVSGGIIAWAQQVDPNLGRN